MNINTLGYVALHERLHHGHRFGGTDGKGGVGDPNKLRNYYNRQTGTAHNTGRKFMIFSPYERKVLDEMRMEIDK